MNTYKIQKAASGDLTLIYSGEREIKLHSAYSPVIEAERSTSGFSKGRSNMIIVSGLALGYHIHHLKNRYPGTSIVAVEHDSEVIELARRHVPENLEGVTIIRRKEDLPSLFEGLDLKKFYGISHYIHRPSYNIHKEFYDGMLTEMRQLVSSKISDLLTRIEFESNWVQNIFSNLHFLYRSVRVKEFFGKFRGYPGVIVSAGPSLKKNVGLIKDMKERALIVCVDTALKVMEKKGVQPHIIMTLDSQKHSIRHFLGLKNDTPLLLADIVSCPAILRSYRGPRVISTTSKYYTGLDGISKRETTPVMDWVEKYTDPIGDIQSGGSVATSAFDLLLNLGCDPIILVGQDLAYTGREIHSSGTHHNDDWITGLTRFLNLDTINQRIIRKRKVKYLEAYGGHGRVISDFVLDLYRGWFSDSAGKVGVRVINATEGGARITNTGEETLLSLILAHEKPAKSPRELIDSVMTGKRNGNKDKLLEAVKRAEKNLDVIVSMIENSGEMNILEFIENSGMTELFNPYLRKTDIFVTRCKIDQEEIVKVYNRDILRACNRLKPVLGKCIRHLGDLE